VEAKTFLTCVSLNANELLLPAPYPEEGGAFTAHASDTPATTNKIKKISFVCLFLIIISINLLFAYIL